MIGQLKQRWQVFDRKWTQHQRQVDRFVNVGTVIAIVVTWTYDRRWWTRLADVKVPNATLYLGWLIARIKWGQIKGPLIQLGKNMEEFGTFQGQRMKQSDERAAQELALQESIERLIREGEERAKQELSLQRSVERLTRRLVVLTYVLGIIGLGGIAATVWATAR